MSSETTSQQFFDEIYSRHPDPWNFSAGAYEQTRYGVMERFLEARQYRRAFEPGCSIGVFTMRLADRCSEVYAVELSPLAAARAQERCGHLPNVRIEQGALPQDIPVGTFDLIVFSEIGYYFTQTQLTTLICDLVNRLEPGGTLLATHWLGHSADHLLSGDQVHTIIAEAVTLPLDRQERHPGFRIDRWRRAV